MRLVEQNGLIFTTDVEITLQIQAPSAACRVVLLISHMHTLSATCRMGCRCRLVLVSQVLAWESATKNRTNRSNWIGIAVVQ